MTSVRGSTRPRRADGAGGWDDYAPFYDWENARTIGRRDVRFWQRLGGRAGGPVLELGCGTGRLLLPLARTGARVTGVDRSAPMLARAAARRRRLPRARRPVIIRADIRALPFPARSFRVVIAPYGMLQSVIPDRDLAAAIGEAARVLRPGGVLGVDLVPDLAAWEEYTDRVSLRGAGPGGRRITLVETVRQDRRRGLTTFEDRFIVRHRGRTTSQSFHLTFRTRSMHETIGQLGRAGFDVEAVCGDYRGGPWDPAASVWVVVARRRPIARSPITR
jgi:ubiquinone/menaquinone biosynthesis C-methylase UbiE